MTRGPPQIVSPNLPGRCIGLELASLPLPTSCHAQDPCDAFNFQFLIPTRQYVPPKVQGLGRLPQHLPSVSSLLLFNTSENPYKVSCNSWYGLYRWCRVKSVVQSVIPLVGGVVCSLWYEMPL